MHLFMFSWCVMHVWVFAFILLNCTWWVRSQWCCTTFHFLDWNLFADILGVVHTLDNIGVEGIYKLLYAYGIWMNVVALAKIVAWLCDIGLSLLICFGNYEIFLIMQLNFTCRSFSRTSNDSSEEEPKASWVKEIMVKERTSE